MGRRANRVSRPQEHADVLGITCALVCLLHCWAIPVLLLVAPSVHLLDGLTSPLCHQLIFIVTLFVALSAIGPELKRNRDPLLAATLGMGLSLLFTEAFVFHSASNLPSSTSQAAATDAVQAAGIDHGLLEWIFSLLPSQFQIVMIAALRNAQPWLSPLGGCCLLAAHFINLRNKQRQATSMSCRSCPTSDHS